MGTHPIFESDFDCLTDKKTRKWQSQLVIWSKVLWVHVEWIKFYMLQKANMEMATQVSKSQMMVPLSSDHVVLIIQLPRFWSNCQKFKMMKSEMEPHLSQSLHQNFYEKQKNLLMGKAIHGPSSQVGRKQ